MALNDNLTISEKSKLAVWDYPVSDKFTKVAILELRTIFYHVKYLMLMLVDSCGIICVKWVLLIMSLLEWRELNSQLHLLRDSLSSLRPLRFMGVFYFFYFFSLSSFNRLGEVRRSHRSLQFTRDW